MFSARGVPLRVAVPALAAITGMVVTAAPNAAQAAGPPRPGAPVATAIPGAAAGPSVTQAVAPPQPGDTPGVAATGQTSGVLAVLFYTGSDSHAYAAPLEAATPTPPESLGGRLIGGPGPTFIPPGSIGGTTGAGAVFGRGRDNALWAFSGNGWSSLGGRLTSRPGAAAGALSVSGGESLNAVVRGADGAVWDREFTATTGLPWVSLGGRVLAGTGPAAVNIGGSVYVLAVGTDHALWAKHSADGTHWSGWSSLGGRVSGDIGAAAPAPMVGVAFARGADSAAWYKEFAGTTSGVTGGWHRLGGRLTSGVGAGSAPDGMTWALVLGADNHIWRRSGVWPTLNGWSRVF